MTHYFQYLETSIKDNWEKTALCNYQGESFSFRDVAELTEKFHIFFRKIGIRKGDHIALCAKNSARWGITFLSVNTYGAVVVPLLSDFHPTSINNLVHHSESVVLFTDDDIWKNLDIKEMPLLRVVINVRDFKILYSSDDSAASAYDAIKSEFETAFPMGFSRDCVCYPKDNDKDIAVINYTSGTTSAPKGVMLRYECFSTMVEYSIPHMPVHYGDTMVSMLPMGHIYGLMFEFIFPFSQGATVYYFGKTPSPTVLLKAMKEVKPFMVITVPLVMEKVYKSSIKPVVSKWYMKILMNIPLVGYFIKRKIRMKLLDAFGGNITEFIMGGAPLNHEVEKCFRRLRLPYTVGYGMTEASPLLAYSGWRKFVPGSCGRAIDYTDIRIDSEDPLHIDGEIQAKGSNICSGYFKNPEAQANAFTADGYLRTGDLGIIDKEGNIFIKGRSKNMILSANGQNIYPEEIESLINSQNYIAESVVVDRSAKLVALIYLDKDMINKDKLDEESVSDIPETVRVNVNRQLPNYSQIAKVEVMTAPFEKTPKMSIKRFLYK